MNSYTIGQVAEAAGVPTSTVRYYERAGLFRPDARTGSNYRQYSDRALERLRFIKSAQSIGFSLEDIRELLSLSNSDEAPCAEVAELTQKRLSELRKKIRDLRRVERVLAKSLANCCKGEGPDLCDRVVGLRGVVGQRCCTPGTKCETCP